MIALPIVGLPADNRRGDAETAERTETGPPSHQATARATELPYCIFGGPAGTPLRAFALMHYHLML